MREFPVIDRNGQVRQAPKRGRATMVRGLAVVCLLAQLGSPVSPASAQTAEPPLTIESAVPDETTGTLTIAGSGFGTRPFVTLDLVPLNVQLALQQRIIAIVPVEMIPPGTYLLTVTRGLQPGDTASFDVRLGPPDSGNATMRSGAVPAATTTGSPATVASAAPAGAASSASTSTNTPALLLAPTDVVARVGDRTFTVADVDREWQRTDPAGFLSASRQLYDARRRAVSDMVNSELLAREAASRGMAVDALLAEELPKRTVPLPDNALSTLYQSLGSRTRGASLEQLQPALREWLARKVEPDLAKMTYLEELTKVSTRADILLQAPRVDVVHAADDPTIGPPTAPVELVIFGDFQNSTYARYALTIPRVRDLFGGRVRFIFKHFPANDATSIAAAEAAACANRQGKFWEFHDTLLGAAGALDTARFKTVAADIGLDRTTFDTCVDRHETRDRIGHALEELRQYDLPGTPSLLVNGRLAPPPPAFLPPFEYFKRIVEEELARQARDAR